MVRVVAMIHDIEVGITHLMDILLAGRSPLKGNPGTCDGRAVHAQAFSAAPVRSRNVLQEARGSLGSSLRKDKPPRRWFSRRNGHGKQCAECTICVWIRCSAAGMAPG